MIKKYLCFALCCLLFLSSADFTLVSAQINTGDNSSSVAKIKAYIAERGTGKNKRVEVKKLDGTKLEGYVNQADDESFTLVDSKTKQNTIIAYRDVAKVKNKATRGDKIALYILAGAGIAAAVVVVSYIGIICKNEGGC